MRKCKVYGLQRKEGASRYERVELFTASFHCWGTEPNEDGAYSVAIVEKDDGSVTTVSPDAIVFIKDALTIAEQLEVRR